MRQLKRNKFNNKFIERQPLSNLSVLTLVNQNNIMRLLYILVCSLLLQNIGFSQITFNETIYQNPLIAGANDVAKTHNGDLIICGDGGPAGSMYMLRVSSTGDSLWMKFYGEGEANSIMQTKDSSFVIAGRYSNGSGSRSIMIKTNQNGDTL